MSKTKTPKKPSGKRRFPKRLSTIFYCYVEPSNGKFAREYGKKNFGSFSAYVDRLIATDRKDKFVSVPVTISKLKKQAKKTIRKVAVKKVKKPKAVKTKTQTPTTELTVPGMVA